MRAIWICFLVVILAVSYHDSDIGSAQLLPTQCYPSFEEDHLDLNVDPETDDSLRVSLNIEFIPPLVGMGDYQLQYVMEDMVIEGPEFVYPENGPNQTIDLWMSAGPGLLAGNSSLQVVCTSEVSYGMSYGPPIDHEATLPISVMPYSSLFVELPTTVRGHIGDPIEIIGTITNEGNFEDRFTGRCICSWGKILDQTIASGASGEFEGSLEIPFPGTVTLVLEFESSGAFSAMPVDPVRIEVQVRIIIEEDPVPTGLIISASLVLMLTTLLVLRPLLTTSEMIH